MAAPSQPAPAPVEGRRRGARPRDARPRGAKPRIPASAGAPLRARWLPAALIGVAAALIACAAWLFADAFSKYAAQDSLNAELQAYVALSDDPNGAPVVDWAALEAVDPNVCAWLQVPGTSINYPIYQAEDNEYYLNTTAEGEWGIGGQVFLDCDNANPGLVDEQTLVYGHHLQNGSMFAPIAELDDQGAFDELGLLWYVTREGATQLVPLLCYRTVGTDENVRAFTWPSEDDFHAYLQALVEKAPAKAADARTLVSAASHVLTLSTCSYEEDNGRTLLVSVPAGEAARARAQA